MKQPPRSTNPPKRQEKPRLTTDGTDQRFVGAAYSVPRRQAALGSNDAVITPSGRIRIGAQFLATHHVSKDSRARLYWDASTSALAISFTQAPMPSAFPIRILPSKDAHIDARQFFSRHLSDVERTRYVGRYCCEVIPAKEVGITDTDSDVCIVHL